MLTYDVTVSVDRMIRGCCSLSLSFNGGADFSTILAPSLPFRFDPLPVVTNIYPNHGPASGGTILSVTGAGFWDGDVTCIFGEIPYSAEFVRGSKLSPSEVMCVTPVEPKGNIHAQKLLPRVLGAFWSVVYWC